MKPGESWTDVSGLHTDRDIWRRIHDGTLTEEQWRAHIDARRARAARRDRIVIWIIGGVPLLWAIFNASKSCGG